MISTFRRFILLFSTLPAPVFADSICALGLIEVNQRLEARKLSRIDLVERETIVAALTNYHRELIDAQSDLEALLASSLEQRAQATELDFRLGGGVFEQIREAEKRLRRAKSLYEAVSSKLHARMETPLTSTEANYLWRDLVEYYGEPLVLKIAARLDFLEPPATGSLLTLMTSSNAGPSRLRTWRNYQELWYALELSYRTGIPVYETEYEGAVGRYLSPLFDPIESLEEHQKRSVEIFQAVLRGDMNYLRQVAVQLPRALYQGDEMGFTPIDYAVAQGRQDVLEFLLSDEVLAAANQLRERVLNRRTNSGRGLLEIAFAAKKQDQLRYLIDQEIVRDEVNLMRAVLEDWGWYEGASNTVLTPDQRVVAQVEATHDLERKLNTLRAYLESSTRPTALKIDDIFQMALLGGLSSPEVLRGLFELGANPNLNSVRGEPYVLEFARERNLRAVASFVAAGASGQLRGTDGRTLYQELRNWRRQSENQMRLSADLDILIEATRPPSWWQRIRGITQPPR